VTDPRLLADVKAAESCRLDAYKDTKGLFTIGWGHKLDQHMDWTGHTITQAVADSYLASDLDNATVQARTLSEWPYLDTPCRENALTELVFNMGFGAWLEFRQTRSAIKQQRWKDAHDALLDSLWARQVQPHGILNEDGTERPGRATRLAGYLLSGQYPI